MIIRHIEINNFRGIKNMAFSIPTNMVCLIGSCDSTKTTILDAIELALIPRRYFHFHDTDFHNLDTSKPISIAVCVSLIPEKLMGLQAYGSFLRGWNATAGVIDDPDDTSDAIVTVVLTVDGDLNPHWTVEKPSTGESKEISEYNRGMLGMARIGADVERQFSWGRGSSLAKITERKSDVRHTIVQTMRSAKNILDNSGIPELDSVVEIAEKAAQQFGLLPTAPYRASLDAGYSLESGCIALHQGTIPLRMLGFGSRKLLAMSLEQASVEEGSILLVDEIEHGLEPHRIRQLLRTLKSNIAQGQAIFTTHSPSSIFECDPVSLYVVRCQDGVTTLYQCSDSIVNIVRSCATALLAKRIIVCEGKTELGICRGLAAHWENETGYGIAHLGMEFVDGGGTDQLHIRALALKNMGYDVAVFVDSDKSLTGEAEMIAKQIPIHRWEAPLNTEGQLCKDLDWDALKRYVICGEARCGDKAAQYASLKAYFSPFDSVPESIDDFRSAGFDDTAIRKKIALCSTNKKWFKDIEPGVQLADLIHEHVDSGATTYLAKTVMEVRAWVYGDIT